MKPLIIYTLALSVLLCTPLHAWDYFYSGDSLLDDPALGAAAWESTGVLHNTTGTGFIAMIDSSVDQSNFYFKHAAISGQSLTVEIRLRIVAGSLVYWHGTPDRAVLLRVSEDILDISYHSMTKEAVNASFSEFRTIRVAMNALGWTEIYLDGHLASQNVPTLGNQGIIQIGFGRADTGSADIDYIAYSTDYVPVPEPATLVTLACGLAGMAGVVQRKAKQ